MNILIFVVFGVFIGIIYTLISSKKKTKAFNKQLEIIEAGCLAALDKKFPDLREDSHGNV